MPVITSIKPQKNKKRVNIHLDGKFGFGLDLENFMKLGLKVEQELSEKEIENIINKAEFQKTLNKLLVFATLRPRSEKEIIIWYKKHKVHESIQKKLFNRLKRLELVDDEKFAKWWVGQRLQFRHKSRRELIQELRIKGIKKETVDIVISSTEIDEAKAAGDLLQKRKYKWQRLEEREARRKKTEYLARKGFGWDIIKQAINEE